MNTTRQLVVILVGATLGAAALAQEATPDTWMNATSSKSRDVVRAELRQAQQDGSIVSEAYNFAGRTPSITTREQVRAELVAAKTSGEFEALNAESHSFQAPRERLYARTAAR